MKLGTLNAARGGLGVAQRVKVKTGRAAIRLEKELARLSKELEPYDRLLKSLIEATGKKRIEIDDPEYSDISRKLSEAGQEEIADPEALIEEDDLENLIGISALEISEVRALGFIITPHGPEAVTSPEQKPSV